jgi:prepilin-type N-terminal cleavage/methylation domain-containing protein/prepilin-type processing-associated H-X9-DG protein
MFRLSRADARRYGFTLVELLVVLAIIAVLVALLLPAVQKAHESAARSQCAHNLKQIALALHQYHETHGSFPPGSYNTGVSGTPCYGNWAICILPHLEQGNLFQTYKDYPTLNESAANQGFRLSRVKTYECPSDPLAGSPAVPASGPGAGGEWGRGAYRAVSGKGVVSNANLCPARLFWDTYEPHLGTLSLAQRGVLHAVSHPLDWPANLPRIPGGVERFHHIKDGASSTLLVGEFTPLDAPERGTFWAYSYASYNQSTVSEESRILGDRFNQCVQIGAAAGQGDENACKRGFGSNHGNGLNFAFADGSTRFISYDVDIRLLSALATLDGGEVVPGQF